MTGTSSVSPSLPHAFPPPPARWRTRAVRMALRIGMLLLLACAVVMPTAVRADTINVESAEIRAEEDGIYLNAAFDFTLNATLEEALQKGVALYFVLEAEV